MKSKSNKTAESQLQPRANSLWFTRDTLSKAFALSACAICQAMNASQRKAIYYFLCEGMMFLLVRQEFLSGGGFRVRHCWMAKVIEDTSWQTGDFGLAPACSGASRSRRRNCGQSKRNCPRSGRPGNQNLARKRLVDVLAEANWLPDHTWRILLVVRRNAPDGAAKSGEEIA